MRPAVTSATPGRVSSCSTVAVFRSRGADGVAGPAAASGGGGAGSPGPGTRTCSPSVSLRARLTASRSAPEVTPPAAVMASWTRLPAGRRTSPGWRTRPATWTATWPEGPAPPGDPAAPEGPAPAVGPVPAGDPAPAEVSGAARGRVWSAGAAPSWPPGAPASLGVARAQTTPAPTSASSTSRATATRWRPAPASTARTRARGPSGGRTNGGGCDMALPSGDRRRPVNLAARAARRFRSSTPPGQAHVLGRSQRQGAGQLPHRPSRMDGDLRGVLDPRLAAAGAAAQGRRAARAAARHRRRAGRGVDAALGGRVHHAGAGGRARHLRPQPRHGPGAAAGRGARHHHPVRGDVPGLCDGPDESATRERRAPGGEAPMTTTTSTSTPSSQAERLRALAGEQLARDRWSRDRLLAFQAERLRALIAHAVAASPWYRGLLAVLHRRDHRPARPVRGRPGRARGLARHLPAGPGQLGPGTRLAGIGSPSPLHISNQLYAVLLAGQPSAAPRLAVTTPLPEMVAALNAFPPQALTAYPTVAAALAEEQLQGRLRIAPSLVATTSEVQTADMRRRMTQAWGWSRWTSTAPARRPSSRPPARARPAWTSSRTWSWSRSWTSTTGRCRRASPATRCS